MAKKKTDDSEPLLELDALSDKSAKADGDDQTVTVPAYIETGGAPLLSMEHPAQELPREPTPRERWLTDVAEVQAVLARGDVVSRDDLRRLLVDAIPLIDTATA